MWILLNSFDIIIKIIMKVADDSYFMMHEEKITNIIL